MLTLIAILLLLAAAIVVVVLINPSLAEKAGTDAEQEAKTADAAISADVAKAEQEVKAKL